MRRSGSRKKPAVTLRALLPILLPVCILLVLTGVLYIVFGKQMLDVLRDPQVFKTWLDSFGAWGETLFVLLRTGQTVFKFIPAEPLEVASGYIFGIWGGLLWCMLGTELGSLFIILFSKKFGMRFVSKCIDADKLRSFAFLQENPRRKTLLFLIYLIPGAPKDLLTYFIGFTDIKILAYLGITAIARIPSIITSTMCGAYFGQKNYTAAILVYAATLLLSGVGLLIYKKIRGKQNAKSVDLATPDSAKAQ